MIMYCSCGHALAVESGKILTQDYRETDVCPGCSRILYGIQGLQHIPPDSSDFESGIDYRKIVKKS